MTMTPEEIAAFWAHPDAPERNRRDWPLKQLEIRAISQHVTDGMRVLDVGCGDGDTLRALARQKRGLVCCGLEPSMAMRDVVASYEWNRDTNSDVRIDDGAFQTLADHRLVKEHGPFGLVYTERSLINLPSADAQAQAIRECCALVKPGGTFLAVEHSQDGLDECNRWRAMLGLPAIEVPIQNRYLRDAEVLACARELAAAGATEAQIIPELGIQVFFGSEDFAGLYYFVSRILHGANPDYDHPDNQTILRLPLGPGPSGFRGYAHAWAFRKVAA